MASVVRRIISTSAAPKPVGPYSQAVIADKTMYISGLIAIDPATGQFIKGNVDEEAEQIMKNMHGVLKAAGSDFNNEIANKNSKFRNRFLNYLFNDTKPLYIVVKTTVLLQDIKDWPAVNVIYGKYFSERHPARAAYQVAALPLGAKVEIEAVAIVGDIEDK